MQSGATLGIWTNALSIENPDGTFVCFKTVETSSGYSDRQLKWGSDRNMAEHEGGGRNQKDSTTDSPGNGFLQLHLEEYRSLQAEGLERTRLQVLIIGSNIALVSLGLGVLKALQPHERSLLIMAVPLLSVVAGLLYLDQSEHVISKDAYVDEVLRPRMVRAAGGDSKHAEILGQREWRSNLPKTSRRVFSFLALTRMGAAIAPGILLLVVLGAEWISHPAFRARTTWVEYTLFAIDLGALVLLMAVAIWLRDQRMRLHEESCFENLTRIWSLDRDG